MSALSNPACRTHRGSVLIETMTAIVLVVTTGLTMAQATIQIVAAERIATMTGAAGRAAAGTAGGDDWQRAHEGAISLAVRSGAPTWLQPRVTVRRSPRSGIEEIRVVAVAPRVAPWWPDTSVRDQVTITRSAR